MNSSPKMEILNFESPVLLAGPADINFGLLSDLMHRGFPLIAADGGANRLLDLKIPLNAIIGDMDSLDPAAGLDAKTRLIRLEEQDSTDFEKCLYSVDALLFLAFGFSGKRFDHTLATLHAMTKYHDRKNVLLLGGEDISFVHRGNFEFSTGAGAMLSIFPLRRIEFSHSEGLEYPLAGPKFEIGREIGTSNRTNADRVKIFPAPAYRDTPYLVSLPNSALKPLIDAHL